MYVKKPKKQCPYNEGVECNEDDVCECCGWNPAGRTRHKERRRRKQTQKPQTTAKEDAQGDGKRRADNKSGHPGVHWLKAKGKWGAEIYANRSRYGLGTFEKMEDAIQAREEAEKKFRKTKRE